MRWFWFATFTLICSLLSVFFRQPLILIGEILIVDLFITRKIKWLFWFPQSVHRVPGWLNMILWLAITVWVIRVLAIDSLTIETTANKPALQPGDNILVSKVHFGPRLPFTSYRLSGFTSIKRGDLLAFNFPEGDSIVADAGPVSYYALKRRSLSDNDTLFNPAVTFQKINNRVPEVSRCVGLPGDTIFIHSADEGKRYRYAIQQYDYLVEMNGQLLPDYFVKMLGLTGSEVQFISGLGCLLPLQPGQVIQVRQRPEVTALAPYFMDSAKGDYNIFPHDVRYPWNRDNFGLVIVPRKGDSIRLTLLNLCIYQRIIEAYENNRLEERQGQIFINGSQADTYTFKQDYFFVLGDNRHHSRDSRHWGFLPKDHIIGKPLFIWFSATKRAGEHFRIYWNRILNIL